LSKIYRNASSDAIDFLQKTIEFNPFLRDSVHNALHHDFFKPIHTKEMEVPGPKIELDFDNPDIKLTLE
jgi:serine/threonine protein kinase